MNLKFLDLKYQTIGLEKRIFHSIKKNISNSSFIGGEDLIKFQEEFSNYLKVKFCLGVANGTDALEIAIKSLELKKGSEVLVPANTWISAAEAVLNNNLNLKFVDVDDTHNICVNDLEKINKNTGAIIIVHLYGNPANVDKILELKKDLNLKLLRIALKHMVQNTKVKRSLILEILEYSVFFLPKI